MDFIIIMLVIVLILVFIIGVFINNSPEVVNDIELEKTDRREQQKEQTVETEYIDNPDDRYSDINNIYHTKIQEANSNKLEDLKRQRIEREAKAKKEEKKILQNMLDREQDIRSNKKYMNSISTLNPIKWAKYSLIIKKAEKKFIEIYNFQTPHEYKTMNHLMSLASTLLFEEVRIAKLSPVEFIELLVGLGGDGLARYIKPVGNDLFNFEIYRAMYSIYLDFRAREVRPFVAMMVTIQSMDETIEKEDITKLLEEYNLNPFFGRSV